MKNNKTNVAKAITKVANRIANNAGGSASIWSTYQPKEPQKKQ